MSAQVTFYGFIKAQDTDWETFDFVMSDIYVKELGKWLKADSVDSAKAFFNLETLKSAKDFSFYTMSESTARWAVGEKRILNDFFQYKKSSKSLFNLKIIASSSDFTTIIKCSDCQPLQVLLAPTPAGTMQSYSIKYKTALFEKFASSPGVKSGA